VLRLWTVVGLRLIIPKAINCGTLEENNPMEENAAGDELTPQGTVPMMTRAVGGHAVIGQAFESQGKGIRLGGATVTKRYGFTRRGRNNARSRQVEMGTSWETCGRKYHETQILGQPLTVESDARK